MTGSKSRIEHYPLPEDDPLQRRPDISLAKAELNWTPEIDLRAGLQTTIEYFEQLLQDS
jgi:UDP-glucuronate decarboxylase